MGAEIHGGHENNEEYFNRVYNETCRSVSRFVVSKCGNREDAEDIMIEGFVKVFSGLEKFKQESSLETWIHSIMVNASISYFRKNSKHYQVGSLDDENIDVARAAAEAIDSLHGGAF